MRINRADGTDRIAIQVGQVHGRRDSKPAKDSPAKDGKSCRSSCRSENTVSGNARVGIQADTVTGPIHIPF